MHAEKATFIPRLDPGKLAAIQQNGLKWTVNHAYANNSFYRDKLSRTGMRPEDIRDIADLANLPMTSVDDLRREYPLPLLSVPEKDVVRIHASSGTTGKRKILAYTQNDIYTWKEMMARCYELAGLTAMDRVQIAVGYGLWTAGAGFQLGCEHFGAMAVPLGPGNLDFHLQFLTDMQSTCLCSTASMALLLAEQIQKRNLKDKIALRRLIFGAETHTPKMRAQIEEILGLEDSFDIPGMTEIYGPGTGLECAAHQGMHYWADKFILEIVDPETLKPVQPGEIGEMVVTTLCKEAAPLIRYRTRDLTRIIPGECPCGLQMPRHDRILGRSDDMIIFRGVNIYPGQIADVLEKFPEISSEYLIQLSRKNGVDLMNISVERNKGGENSDEPSLLQAIARKIRQKILIRAEIELVDPGQLPRTFGKTKRVLDERNES
ncbi:MAG: phenylacetate--CoA ligase family protein [Thermodesulfobacteriota bacterium]